MCGTSCWGAQRKFYEEPPKGFEFVPGSEVEIGMIVYLMREFVCRVTWLARTNHSKCGGPKLMLLGRDIYTGKEVREGYPRDSVVPVPEHRIVQYTCLDVEDGYLKLLD